MQLKYKPFLDNCNSITSLNSVRLVCFKQANYQNTCYFCNQTKRLTQIKAPQGGGLIYVCPKHGGN